MDAAWWAVHGDEAAGAFTGDLVTLARDAWPHGASVVEQPPEGFGNSGAMAARLALDWCDGRVILLGYDCQHAGGKTHWHGSHPKGLGDAASVPKWFAQFDAVAAVSGDRVINCTRETALTCFPCGDLEVVLGV